MTETVNVLRIQHATLSTFSGMLNRQRETLAAFSDILKRQGEQLEYLTDKVDPVPLDIPSSREGEAIND